MHAQQPGPDMPGKLSLRDELARAPLVPLAAAFTAGVVLDRALLLPFWFALLALASFLAAFSLARLGRPSPLSLLHLGLAALFFGAAWHGRGRLVGPDDVCHRVGTRPIPAIVRGTLTEEPRRVPAPKEPDALRSQPEEPTAHVVLALRAFVSPEGERPLTGRVRVTVSPRPGDSSVLLAGLHPGDEVEVSGRLEGVPVPGNPGERDRAARAADQGVRAVLRARPGGVLLLAEGWRHSLWGWLGATRDAAHGRLDAWLPASTAPLARALLLGEGAPLRREDWMPYIHTGVVHVLAISGQHLVVIALFLWWALRRVGVRQAPAAVGILVVLVGYALLTGARPPAMRAAVLAGVFCLALVMRRPTNTANLFALAWLVVGVMHPPDLFETGCQLSFWSAAVLTWGLGTVFREGEPDPLQRLIDESRPPLLRLLVDAGRATRKAFLAGALAWLLISPLVAFHTAGFAPAALLLGPPLALLTSVALIAGFLLLLLFWLPPIAALLAAVVHLALLGCKALTGLGDRLAPYLLLDPVPGWWVAGLLAGLAALAVWPMVPIRWMVVGGLLWLVMLLGQWSLPRSTSGGLTVTFLEVGHGGCAVLELPDGRAVLYDVGAMRGPQAAETIAAYLTARGVRRVDEVVLSHADLDHYNALPGLIDRLAVGRVLTSPTFASKANAAVRFTMGRLRARGVPVQTVVAGDRLEGGGVVLDVLHPPAGWDRGNENARSVVLEVRHGEHAVLLTGDLEGEGLDHLLRSPPRKADVLQAPHHGSHRVDLPAVVRWCRPGLVVSCQGERDGPPRRLGVPFWATGEEGAVTVRSAGGLTASTYRRDARLTLVDAPRRAGYSR